MASKGLYKRWNVWWIRYAGVDGRVRKETTQTTNHREAQALLIKRKQGGVECSTVPFLFHITTSNLNKPQSQ